MAFIHSTLHAPSLQLHYSATQDIEVYQPEQVQVRGAADGGLRAGRGGRGAPGAQQQYRVEAVTGLPHAPSTASCAHALPPAPRRSAGAEDEQAVQHGRDAGRGWEHEGGVQQVCFRHGDLLEQVLLHRSVLLA